MLIVNFSIGKFKKFCTYILNLGTLVTIGIAGNFVPNLDCKEYRISFEHYAYAQNYTRQEIINYSRAGFQIEILRQQTYHNIKTIINRKPPNITCNQPGTLQNLAPNISNIANDYCSNTMRIIRDNNLTVPRFNQLKQYYDQGGDFHQQVQQMLLEVQNQEIR